jgi:SAM-dependent methyltransferase
MDNKNFYNEDYFLGTSGTRGDFSLLELDTKFIDRTQTVIDYFDLKHVAKGQIAEVGCGTAPFYRLVGKNPELAQLQVVCSDVTEGGVNLLDELDKPPFQLAGAEKLPYEDSSLLGVVEWDVLEHIEHPEEAITEAYRVLCAGGFFHVVCPNPDSWLRNSSDPEKDPYRRDKSHVFPPIVTYKFLDESLKGAGFEHEIFTRGFEGRDGKNQTGLESMKLAEQDSSGTHLVVFAKKKAD